MANRYAQVKGDDRGVAAGRDKGESSREGELIKMHTLELKRQVRRRQYAVDVDAVAAAIVHRIVSRRAAAATAAPSGRATPQPRPPATA
jgi:hypothetical protein